MAVTRLHAAAAAIAVALLAAIVAYAALRHEPLRLAYEESGNGCRTLTAAGEDELERAMRPAQWLLSAWIAVCGLALTAALARRLERRGPAVVAVVAGVVLAGALAAIVPEFAVIDGLSALVVGFVVVAAAAPLSLALAIVAGVNRRHRAALPLASCAAWLLLSGLLVPIALVALTGSGEIRSC